jgi:single-stranded-DNA-specific exonuclease
VSVQNNNFSYIQGSKYMWLAPHIDIDQALQVASWYNLSLPIAQALVTRGMIERAHLDSYLFSSFGKDVADPVLMKDALKAVSRINKAIEAQEKILICGDYDVDGITSSAIFMACLPQLGAHINFFLPHRVKDGYGLSPAIVKKAADNGYRVLVTVDNGITAFEAALEAKKLGVDLIITDHHRPHGHVPDAYAIVNPNQIDCAYPYKSLAGVGVTFKVVSLLYREKGLELPAKVYELLLLGTVADVVPLTGENRFWVRHGLSYVNKQESISLKTLKANSNCTKQKISSTDIGFFIAPQINALGRLEDARAGVGFLIGSDVDQIQRTGRVLHELNTTRKEIERGIFSEIVSAIESKRIDINTEKLILAASSSWPPGVIGLVASRLVSEYGRPAILLHVSKNGVAKGSCRSIREFNLFNALQKCEDLLIQFGGHSVAAGLSLEVANISRLKERLEDILAQELTEFDLKQKIAIDAPLALSELGQKFMADIEYMEPFGNENSCPVFIVRNVTQVQPPQLMKGQHVKCSIFADGVIKSVVFFGRPDLYDRFTMLLPEATFDVVARVTENHWNGRVNIELLGIDVAF